MGFNLGFKGLKDQCVSVLHGTDVPSWPTVD